MISERLSIPVIQYHAGPVMGVTRETARVIAMLHNSNIILFRLINTIYQPTRRTDRQKYSNTDNVIFGDTRRKRRLKAAQPLKKNWFCSTS